MNWDIVKGQWKQIKGDARKQWGDLTDDDWERIGGDKDKMVGWLQEKYGWAKNDAERNADDFFGRYSDSTTTTTTTQTTRR